MHFKPCSELPKQESFNINLLYETSLSSLSSSPRSSFVKVLFGLPDAADLLLPELCQRGDELLLSALQQPVELVVDVQQKDGELLQGVCDDDLVVGERRADALELEVGQAVGQRTLGLRELPRGLKNILV